MIPDSECNVKCVGDQMQTCGGNWTRNVFYSGTFFSAPGMFNIKVNFIIINHRVLLGVINVIFSPRTRTVHQINITLSNESTIKPFKVFEMCQNLSILSN